MTREDTVKEFHEAFGLDVGEPFSRDLVDLRINLLDEEVSEFWDEFHTDNPYSDATLPLELLNKEKVLKELADIQYVLSGLAVTFGLDLDEAFKRVHESNMSKLGEDGKPIYREDGKVLKGPNYKEPDLSDLVEHLV